MGSQDVDDPALTEDERVIYYNMGHTVIFRASRATREDPWGPPIEQSDLTAGGLDATTVAIAPDELEIHISINNDIYASRRPSTVSAWQPASVVEILSSPGGDRVSSMSTKGILLSVDNDLRLAMRSGGSWSSPRLIPAPVRSDQPEGGASLRDDLLCFARIGASSGDIFFSRHDAQNDRWSEPQTAGAAINAPDSDEQDCWLAPGLERMYFASNRDDGPIAIYVASRL